MRHDPASGALIVMLRSLKMHGMAQAVGELTEQGSPAFGAAVPILSQLLKAEMAEREVRSTAYQLKAARFPNYRDLAGFDLKGGRLLWRQSLHEHLCAELRCMQISAPAGDSSWILPGSCWTQPGGTCAGGSQDGGGCLGSRGRCRRQGAGSSGGGAC